MLYNKLKETELKKFTIDNLGWLNDEHGKCIGLVDTEGDVTTSGGSYWGRVERSENWAVYEDRGVFRFKEGYVDPAPVEIPDEVLSLIVGALVWSNVLVVVILVIAHMFVYPYLSLFSVPVASWYVWKRVKKRDSTSRTLASRARLIAFVYAISAAVSLFVQSPFEPFPAFIVAIFFSAWIWGAAAVVSYATFLVLIPKEVKDRIVQEKLAQSERLASQRSGYDRELEEYALHHRTMWCVGCRKPRKGTQHEESDTGNNQGAVKAVCEICGTPMFILGADVSEFRDFR